MHELLSCTGGCERVLLWSVGALQSDRNMCWENKLQVCLVKDTKTGYLHFTHSTTACFAPVKDTLPPPGMEMYEK